MMKQLRARPAFRRFPGLWLTFVFVFLAGFIWVMLASVKPEIQIPYNSFIEQIRVGNVTTVQFSGDEVTGSFVTPVERSPVADGSITGQSSSSATGGYSVFRTTLPSPTDTSSLLSVLAKYGIPVAAVNPAKPWFITALTYVFPLGLLLLVAGWVARQSMYAPCLPSKRV